MYLSYYNLKAKPFQMSTDPAFLWLGEKHKEALAILKYAILENKGVLALTGDVGTGKTTLINALLKSLGEDTVTATIYDPRLDVLDFFNTVAAAFGIKGTFNGKGEFILQIMDFLIKTYEQGQKVLLIIDEAQGINNDLLEEIRLLSNLEAEYTRLLNIFFVGQNEFTDILQKYENRALRQRVTIRYHIQPLTLNETAAYIKHRLKVAGTEALIFDSGAIDEIYFFSGGYPRLINIMCDHALLSGYVREIQVVNASLIRECREELLVSKKTSEADFQYTADDHRSSPNETIFTEPPPDPFIPVEDPHYQEDEQMVFSKPLTARELAGHKKSSKKSLFRSPIAIAILLVIGLVTGYFFYSSDKNTSASFVTSARQKTKKYLSANTGTNNTKPSMVPTPSETSDMPDRVEAGKVGDSRFVIVKSPNSSLVEENISKETETPPSISSQKYPKENGVQSYATKPNGPDSVNNQKTVRANRADASDVSPEKFLETEKSPREAKPVVPKPDDAVSSGLKKEVPAIVPITEKTPEKMQMSAQIPLEIASTSPNTGVASTEIADQKKSVTMTTSKKKQSAIQTMVPKSKTPDTIKKKATTIVKIPLINPSKETAISKNNLSGENQIVSKKKAQLSPQIQEENKDVGRIDKKVDSLGVTETKYRKAGKDDFTLYNLHSRLKAFLNEYCRTYEKKDLGKFSTFFALNAVEKGKPFRFWLSRYRQNFNRLDSIEYNIELDRYATQEALGLVKVDGIFHVRAKLSGSKEWRKSSGQISMVLEADGDSFKVRELNY